MHGPLAIGAGIALGLVLVAAILWLSNRGGGGGGR